MPIYEYECPQCGCKGSVRCPVSERPDTQQCPNGCGEMERVISAPNVIVRNPAVGKSGW